MRLTTITCLLVVLHSTTATAAPKAIKPIKSWKGSVANVGLQNLRPKSGVVTDQKTVNAIFEKWGVKGKAPEVDFKKHLILVATTRGSRMGFNPRLKDDGNLQAFAFATRDLRPGFRYVILQISREGVKKVNGKPLP